MSATGDERPIWLLRSRRRSARTSARASAPRSGNASASPSICAMIRSGDSGRASAVEEARSSDARDAQLAEAWAAEVQANRPQQHVRLSGSSLRRPSGKRPSGKRPSGARYRPYEFPRVNIRSGAAIALLAAASALSPVRWAQAAARCRRRTCTSRQSRRSPPQWPQSRYSGSCSTSQVLPFVRQWARSPCTAAMSYVRPWQAAARPATSHRRLAI